MRPLCSQCNRNLATFDKARQKYNPKCTSCSRGYSKASSRFWLKHRKAYCERCGFLPENMCQLSVDHKDGDKANNDPANLQTLCHNCHALKSYENRDSLNLRHRSYYGLRGTP